MSRNRSSSFNVAPATAPSETDARPDWAALPIDDIAAQLTSSADGLSAAEAAARLERFGPNRLATARRRSALMRLAGQFNNLLIYVLLAAAGLALLIGHSVDALVILAVVIVNTGIGFFQEGKAEDALEAIRSMIDPEATVRRDGTRTLIKADEVVPGDLVLLEAGDRVPADLRLLRARNLKLDEAALTGESVPVEKSTAPAPAATDLAERSSMVFSGTIVVSGQGAGLAVATATQTELGRISGMLADVVELKTPLVRQMDRFARHITFALMGVAVLVFVIALQRPDFALADAFMAVVGLFVAGIPEGLPAIMTITLAIGVQRMAGRKAIIRRLPAVETLGAVSVICSDKTGTLTRNEMTARSIVTADGLIEASGTGYVPEGKLTSDGQQVGPDEHPQLAAILEAASLCNDAEIHEEAGSWKAAGDPMEAALLILAMKAGRNPSERRHARARLDAIPFDSAHKFMATLHEAEHAAGDSGRAIFVKGAPERLIEMADAVLTSDGTVPIDRNRWHARVDELAARGERVLGFALKPVSAEHGAVEADHVESGLVLIGLVGFIDPPREEAIEAVKACKQAGIRVVMITGDHALTAKAIARALGLADDPHVLTGRDLEEMDDAALKKAALETQVFARTTPEHKLRLVEALQADGLTVAMTGDGVNDAPALKRADVGVAMGQKGTEAAKEASEMVLADDNFASIVAAIREGRTVYDNLKKTILFLLPINGGESMTIVFAILAGLEMPITPVQILWVNMVSSVALAMVLAFEPTEPGTMRQKPRPADEPILRGDVVWRIVFISILFLFGAFGMFAWAIDRGLPNEVARTMVVNTIVVMEIFYLFSVRYVHGGSLTLRGLFGTPAVLAGVAAVIVLQLTFTYAPFMVLPFDTAPVAFTDGLAIVAVGVALFVILEIEKMTRLGWQKRRHRTAD
ncbi:MAG: cation-transporting P-type ATPase [Parvibaculum sp.]|uniref:cation-transporting P-type ATPase n=1 Tax=Parvibaculum sp. TaxID=2024848 RepID=UPI0027273411|nr:cation-transporting P-type ATPase [Parvibaculum sp.]MDO8840331.1 cation-transporting P-type ATPase [Parvibaculum sp.]